MMSAKVMCDLLAVSVRTLAVRAMQPNSRSQFYIGSRPRAVKQTENSKGANSMSGNTKKVLLLLFKTTIVVC